MKEVKGDFWKVIKESEFTVDAICCTTNSVVKSDDRLVMGAGIAKEFKERYPCIDLDWGKRIVELYPDCYKIFPMLGCLVTELPKGVAKLVYFQTKYHWKENSDIDLIRYSSIELRWLANKLDWKRIIMTRPGCGNGGLNWNDVKVVLEKYFDDRFIVVEKE